jgi:hypothetical protein
MCEVSTTDSMPKESQFAIIHPAMRPETEIHRAWRLSAPILQPELRKTGPGCEPVCLRTSWMSGDRKTAIFLFLLGQARKASVFCLNYVASWTLTECDRCNLNRLAVRSRQVEGCDSCHENPRASGHLCMVCDRRMPGPRLQELAVGSTPFTDSK